MNISPLSNTLKMNVEAPQMRSAMSCILLFLLGFTCIVEHLPLVEVDFIEIIEGAEKEIDLKDKPLIYNASLYDIQGSFFLKNTSYPHLEHPHMRGIYLDVTSPPPRSI